VNLRRVIVIAMVVLLAGCASTSDPAPSPTPSVATSVSATPDANVTPTPTVAFPVPMSVTQDLTTGGAKQIVRRMMEITNNRPALKLDVSTSEVTLTVLDATQKPFTLRWRANQITPADSDIQYLGQTTFRPTDYPLGNISELFDTATRMLHRAKNGESVVLRLCPQHSPYAATIQSHSAAGAIALERVRRAS